MSGAHTAMALIWVAVGIIVGFMAWSYILPKLPARQVT